MDQTYLPFILSLFALSLFFGWRWWKRRKEKITRMKPFWEKTIAEWEIKTKEAEEEEAKTAPLFLPGISAGYIDEESGNPHDPAIWCFFEQRGEAWRYMEKAPAPQKEILKDLLTRWYMAKFRMRIKQMRNEVILRAFWDMHHQEDTIKTHSPWDSFLGGRQ